MRSFGYCIPGMEAKLNPTIKDIYWTAGIFEGEGHPSRTQSSERASVVQKHTEILKRLKLLFGGSIYIHDKKCSVWIVYGSRARGFLMTIYPLMSKWRQRQIRKVLKG